MTDPLSRSSERYTFQANAYVKRCEDAGEEPSQSYLDLFDKMIEDANKKFLDPESTKDNMEYDLLSTDWILEKVRNNEAYAQNLYAAMCNNDFQKLDMLPILKDQRWHCSWRYAGGIIADMRQEGDYIDWYCSGIRNVSDDEDVNALWDGRKFVSEGSVTDEIKEDLLKLGWNVIEGDE